MERPDIDHLYYQGPHYDQRYNTMTEDIPFWIRRAKEYGDPILELAIGTGRVAIPLAKEGFRITGIDLSDSMTTLGKGKAAQEDVEIEWVKEDIRDFHLGKKFKLELSIMGLLLFVHQDIMPMNNLHAAFVYSITSRFLPDTSLQRFKIVGF